MGCVMTIKEVWDVYYGLTKLLVSPEFLPVQFSSHHYPSGGPYCIAVSVILAYTQSLLELGPRLSIVADKFQCCCSVE